jgi:CRISPR type III-A-associated protein Csm2
MTNTYSIKNIIEKDDPETLVAEAKNLARKLHINDSTKTQIRKLFGTLRQIERSWPTRVEEDDEIQQLDDAYRQLVLFGPRLAYETSRHESLGSIAETVQEGIKYVDKNDRRTMLRLVQFFEAVVAYYLLEQTNKSRRGGQ